MAGGSVPAARLGSIRMTRETTQHNVLGYRQIAAEMRRRILSGEWPPGTRIPTKLELCAEFATSVGTMQRALSLLNNDGFLKPRGCAGTFVREDAPHLKRIGVVFPGDPTHSLMWHAIDREVRRFQLGVDAGLGSYCKCADPSSESGLPRLLEDVENGRIGALVFVGSPNYLSGADVLRNERLARATIGTRTAEQHPADIEVRLTGEVAAVMEHLRQRGRQRVGLLCTYSWGDKLARVIEQVHAHGLRTERRLTHQVDERTPYTCRGITELMMGLPPDQRPDALYIMDDHLVPQATLGLHDAGIRTGRDGELSVVAHANFPYLQTSGVPVTFVGYDIRALLARVIRAIKQRIAGETTESVIVVHPVFQGDLPYDPWASIAQHLEHAEPRPAAVTLHD